MSHWFHRNKLKGTIAQKFDGKGIAVKTPADKMLQDLRSTRANLLQLFTDEVATPESVMEKANAYFELLVGLSDVESSDNKLRYSFRFKWSDTLVMDGKPEVHQDAQFELVSMMLEVAIWTTKYGARVSAKEAISEDDAKEILKLFKKAAGIFQAISTQAERLLDKPDPGTDLDHHILDCYMLQSKAEAQEVTIARAVQIKHKSSLIAALANDTKHFFEEADKQLAAIKKDDVVGKWRKYLQLKIAFYDSYTWCYQGVSELEKEECGTAVKCLQYARDQFINCGKICEQYKKQSGAGNTVHPDKAVFFLNYGAELKRHLEKAERENGFIYHQKIPEKLPELNLKATHGLAEPEAYSLPEKSSRWGPELLSAFDLSEISKREERQEKRSDNREKVPDIKEPDVKITKDNACSIM